MRRQDPAAFDLAALARATDGFSGAELEQAIVSSLYRTLHEHQPLTTALLLQEVGQTAPLSVSRREDIERIREDARGPVSCPWRRVGRGTARRVPDVSYVLVRGDRRARR